MVIAAAYITGRLPMLVMGFLAVVPHELVHAFVAKVCGFPVDKIEVLPVGMVARIDGLMEAHPAAEAAIAMAGPLCNFAIAGAAVFLIREIPAGSYAEQFILINLYIAFFNLLPGLPLDGGRVLRSILSRCMGLNRATIVSAWCGIFLGAAMLSAGMVLALRGIFNLFVVMMGVFLIMAAISEKKRGQFLAIAEITDKKDALIKSGGLPIRQIAVPADTELYQVVQRFRPRVYHMVVAVDANMQPVGCVSEGVIVKAMIEDGASTQLSRLI